MRVECNRISQFDAAKFRFMSLREREWATVCGVNVIPAIIFASNGGELFDRIDDAHRSRASYADDARRQQAFGPIASDLFSETIYANVETIVGRNLAQAIAAHAENVNALVNRVVALVRRINDQIALRRS